MLDEVDFTAVELDYRAGVLPLSAICKKFGVSINVLKSTAAKYGWERKPLDPFLVQQAHGVASLSPAQPKFGMDSDLSAEDVTKSAVATAGVVLDTHRKDVKRLRELSTKFADALVDVFTILQDPKMLVDDATAFQAARSRIGVLIGDKTPTDLLESLSRVMVRLVQIERQSYGLDSLPVNPDAPTASDAVQTEVNRLWQQVQEMQKQKTVH